jgi:hypothetical protein
MERANLGRSAGGARQAAERAAADSGLPGAHDGPQDTFRHCVWQCEATRQAGPFDAWVAGTGHEWSQGGGQDRDEFNSDLHNNECVRQAAGLGKLKRGVLQLDEASSESLSDAAWRNLLGLLPAGQAYDDPGEPTIFEYFGDKVDRFVAEPVRTTTDFVKDVFVIDD